MDQCASLGCSNAIGEPWQESMRLIELKHRRTFTTILFSITSSGFLVGLIVALIVDSSVYDQLSLTLAFMASAFMVSFLYDMTTKEINEERNRR